MFLSRDVVQSRFQGETLGARLEVDPLMPQIHSQEETLSS